MKVIIVCMNVQVKLQHLQKSQLMFHFQGFVVDILVNRSLVGCIAPHISEAGVGMIIKVDILMTEMTKKQRDTLPPPIKKSLPLALWLISDMRVFDQSGGHQ